MGYYSVLWESKSPLTITSTVQHNSKTEEEILLLQRLQEQAKSLGTSITIPEDSTLLTDIHRYLKEHEELSYYFTLDEESGDSDEVFLVPEEEEVKVYSLEEELLDFLRFLSDNEYLMSGKFYVSGEENGDLTRWTISDNSLKVDKAQFVFPDGEVYSS